MASLVKIVAKHLGISQASLIDGVAHRLFAEPGNAGSPDERAVQALGEIIGAKIENDPVAGRIISDGLYEAKILRYAENSTYGEPPRRPHRCAAHDSVRTITQAELDRQEINRPDRIATPPASIPVAGTCRMCGCTDADCSDCIRLTGVACHWIEPDLCSACNSLTAV